MKQVKSQHDIQPDQVGPFRIARAIPNAGVQCVGPIMLLDHMPLRDIGANELPAPDGSFAHPHRGIATFTYVLEGAITHADSTGGHGTIAAGGVQWMNAGNGIIHDEMLPTDLRENGGKLHSFQFWINLPAKNKAEPPQYMPVPAEDLPVIELASGRAHLKVLLGTYNDGASPIPTYAKEFIWHVRIEPAGSGTVELPEGGAAAGFLPAQGAFIGGTKLNAHRSFVLEDSGREIEIINPNAEPLDVLLFGGKPIDEPLAIRGPFVMNSDAELAEAFRDFRNGKYGQITYPPNVI